MFFGIYFHLLPPLSIGTSVILISIHIMDLGSVSSIQFSGLPSDFNLSSPLKSISERRRLCGVAKTLQAKLSVSQDFHTDLKNQLRDMVNLRSQLSYNNHPLGLRVAVLSTSLHALRRYQIILLRNLLILRRYLGGHVSPRMWQTWVIQRDQLEQEVPNVHDLFLWAVDVQEVPYANNQIMFVTPWRPSQ